MKPDTKTPLLAKVLLSACALLSALALCEAIRLVASGELVRPISWMDGNVSYGGN